MPPLFQSARDHVRPRTQIGGKVVADGVKVIRGAQPCEDLTIPRQPARLPVEVCDKIAQRRVLLFAEVGREQQRKFGRLLRVRLLEHRVQRARLKSRALGVLAARDAEGGIDARRIEIGADEPPAEGVDGADLGEGKRRELRLKPLLFRALPLADALEKGEPQPLAHLCRRLIGERDGEDAAHVPAP